MAEHERGAEAPRGISRRSFVRGAAGAAGLAAVASSGLGVLRQAVARPDGRVRLVDYVGTWRSAQSPAPRGLAYVPVRVRDDGLVAALPELDGVDHLDWLRYCGHEQDPGLLPQWGGDDLLRYHLSDEAVRAADATQRAAWWYADRLGSPVAAADFAARPYGSAAKVRWRSEGVTPMQTVTLLLFKLDPGSIEGPRRDVVRRLLDPDHHLVAVTTFCTHLCCLPGYQEDKTARRLDAWDLIYCTCHGSRFDPRRAYAYSFMLRDGAPG